MRKAADVSPLELIRIYQEQMAAHPDNEDGEFSAYSLQDLGKIKDDLKVNVDFENHEIEPWTEIGDEAHGIRRFYLKYGDGAQYLTCIGCYAGGDWQYPVTFFIYLDQDGKTLRCYVPKSGNAWNWDTKEAFGEDDDADRKFLLKWAKKHSPDVHDAILATEDDCWEVHEYAEHMVNVAAMKQDLAERIDVVKIPSPV